MRFARYFVDRPIFAAVLSILIFLAGAIAIWKLPVSEYPEVVPPRWSCTRPTPAPTRR